MSDDGSIENQIEVGVYPKRGITIVKGKNATVWDANGKEYIDCVAGVGVASVGHCNDSVIEAIVEQSGKLITCPEIFHNDKRATLLQKLKSITPSNLKHVFLCNSGTESMEGAIKFARYTTGKPEFICTEGGFHGRSMGALSATHKAHYKKEFEPLIPGFNHVPFNDFDSMKNMVNENTGGIILEIVQGEGGVRTGDADYFRKIRDLCTYKGIILIIDEVQTGFCRTGKMFSCEHFGLEPDILCLAKALAGGFPMGAVVCSDSIKLTTGKHGSTNGGNPLACAAAIASIEYMEKHNLADLAVEKGTYIFDALNNNTFDTVKEIRGLGLMIGIELSVESKPFIDTLTEKGVLALPAGPNVIRLLPPITIEYSQIDKVVETLIEILN